MYCDRGNYSREETIQVRKLFAEIRYFDSQKKSVSRRSKQAASLVNKIIRENKISEAI